MKFSISAVILCYGVTAVSAQPTQAQYIAITEAASKYGVDPKLALAIAETESDFKENAVGKLGEKGIFQLLPKFHSDYSIDSGVQYLALVKQVCSPYYGDYWVVCYNRGPYAEFPEDPENNQYYQKVSKRYNKWVAYEKTLH